MSNKLKIDQEISNLEIVLDNRDDTHPDYLPDYLKSHQNRIFASHARISAGLENRILMELKSLISELPERLIEKIIQEIASYTRRLDYMAKLDKVINYSDILEKTIFYDSLRKVNSIRNIWAHKEGFYLREEYNFNTPKGKEKIRNELRALTKAENLLDDYFRAFLKKKNT